MHGVGYRSCVINIVGNHMEVDISKANPQSFISATENLYWGAFDSDWGKGCVGGVSKAEACLASSSSCW